MIEYRFDENSKSASAWDGDRQIGECDVEEDVRGWSIVHTGVRDGYGGQGIARKLVLLVCDEAEKHSKPVIPVCSYAKYVLK